MIPRLAVAGTDKQQSTTKPVFLRAFLSLDAALAGTVWHLQADFFHGILNGTMRHRCHD